MVVGIGGALTQRMSFCHRTSTPDKFQTLTAAASFSNAFAAFSGLRLAPLFKPRNGLGPCPSPFTLPMGQLRTESTDRSVLDRLGQRALFWGCFALPLSGGLLQLYGEHQPD